MSLPYDFYFYLVPPNRYISVYTALGIFASIPPINTPSLLFLTEMVRITIASYIARRSKPRLLAKPPTRLHRPRRKQYPIHLLS